MTGATLPVAGAVPLAIKAIRERQVTFVCSLYGSTGSFFLYSLLDAHPDTYTFPYDLRRVPISVDDFESRPREAHVRALFEDNDRLFDTTAGRESTNSLRYLGETRDAGIVVDRDRFRAYLTAILDTVDFSLATFTLAVVAAYNFARGVVPRTGRFVLYTHDLGRTVREWRRGFGGGAVLAACRHPVNVYASYCRRRRFEAADRRTLLVPYTFARIVDFPDLPALLAEAGDAVALVLIEELHANPRRSMEAVSAHLGVPFGPSLLESTIGGLKWWGSHQRVGTINGFSPELHAAVEADFLGPRAEAMVWRGTATFQARTGYAAMRPSQPRAGTDRTIARRYYRDLAASARALVRASTGPRRALVMARALRAALRYPGEMREERRLCDRLAAADGASDYSKITVVNPLSAAALRWRGGRAR